MLSTNKVFLLLAVVVLAACASRASPEDAKMAVALSAQGKALLSAGKTSEARDIYFSATSRDDQNARAWNGLGVSYDLLHKRALARDAYEHAIDLAPKDRTAANNLAHLYLAEGNADAAVELLEPFAKMKNAPDALKQNYAKAKKIVLDKEAEQEDPHADLGSFPTEGLAQGRIAKVKPLLEGMEGLSFLVAPDVKTEENMPFFAAKVESKNPQAVCQRLISKGLLCSLHGKK
jgi:tetratricopeptide (TPR) repeat protein